METLPESAGGWDRRQRLLLVELGLMFFVGPLVYWGLDPGPRWLIPALWVWLAACVTILLLDRSFDKRELWNWGGMRSEWRAVLTRFLLLGGALSLLVAVLLPQSFLRLPREAPVVWVIIMIAYPLLSVYPQEIIFRTFFFHRYKTVLVGARPLILTSALAFGHVHVVFGNWVSVPMTIAGGLLFSLTYARSRSTLAASVEHALYGCLVFTIGLGRYFYTGA